MHVHIRHEKVFVEPVLLGNCLRREREGMLRALLPDEQLRMMAVLYDDNVPTINFEDYEHEDSTIQVPYLLGNGNSQRTHANALIMIDASANIDDLIKSLSEQIKNELEG
jgi:hypothetical protein